MKYTFETDSFDEAEWLLEASNLRQMVADFDNLLRNKIEHSTDPGDAWAEKARECLWDFITDANLSRLF